MVLLTGVGLLFMLSMISTVWIAQRVARPERSVVWSEDASPQRPISPTEKRLWLVGWAISGLASFGLAVTEWKYTKGQYVSVPASASLIDQIIWSASLVGIIGVFVAICLYSARQVPENRSRRGDSSGA